jgi:hypothetical protein
VNVLSILFFAGGVVVLILAVTQVLARGWGPLDVSVFDVYFVVLPRYLLLISVALLIAGSFRLLPRISDISKRRSETRITDVTHKIRWDAKAGLWTGCYTFRQRRKRCARVFGGHVALPDRAGSRDAFAGDQPDRPLSNLGHELIVPHAGNVRLIGDGSAYSIPSRPVLSPQRLTGWKERTAKLPHPLRLTRFTPFCPPASSSTIVPRLFDMLQGAPTQRRCPPLC